MKADKVNYNGKAGFKLKNAKGFIIIFPPEDGWKESSLYLVRASFRKNNPIEEYYFYTGYVNNGIPSGYNEILLTEKHRTIDDLIYLEAVSLLHTKACHSSLDTPNDLEKSKLLSWSTI